MAQYPNQQPYSGLALSKLGLGGQSHAPATQTTRDRPKTTNTLLCLPKRQICGLYKEQMAQYPHPQLGQGGQSHAPASKRHLIKLQNNQRYAQNNKLLFYLLKRQIRS